MINPMVFLAAGSVPEMQEYKHRRRRKDESDSDSDSTGSSSCWHSVGDPADFIIVLVVLVFRLNFYLQSSMFTIKYQ